MIYKYATEGLTNIFVVRMTDVRKHYKMNTINRKKTSELKHGNAFALCKFVFFFKKS